VKIPKVITPVWLDTHKVKIVQIYREGNRIALLRNKGRKWAHLTTTADGHNFKIPKDDLRYAYPCKRVRGKWVVDRETRGAV